MSEKIILGSKVRDVVTGLEGMATAWAQHLFGCDRYWVAPPIDKDGKPRDGMWIDVQSLEVVELPKFKTEETAAAKPGGFPSAVK